MKKMKKFASIAAATILAVTMLTATASFSASAADITISGSDTVVVEGHQYYAHQIFKGTLSGNILTDIEWGAGIFDGDGLLTALKKETAFASCTSAADVAAVLENEQYDSAIAQKFADVLTSFNYLTNAQGTTGVISGDSGTITDLDNGYYLITDGNVPDDDAYSRNILKVVGENITVTPKSAVPTVEKKVNEDDNNIGYNDVADYCIGEDVPFMLTGTMPSNLADYTTYAYQFYDTLSAGLTYNDDAEVYLVNGETRNDVTSSFHMRRGNAIGDRVFTCDDLIAAMKDAGFTLDKDSKIVVEYTAKLDSDAVIGLDGNPNEVTLTYSNNPNQGGEGDYGTTPKDTVIVFTYKFDGTKVDGADNNTTLEGAEFKIKNAEGKYAIVDADGKLTGWADTEAGGSTITSAADGTFGVIGLDDGDYTLVETKAPDGYNTMKDLDFTINATTVNGDNFDGTANAALTAIEITADGTTTQGNVADGSVALTVENNKGSELPETGGIGTKIFYAAGGTVAVAAGVLLITKKRMKKEEE